MSSNSQNIANSQSGNVTAEGIVVDALPGLKYLVRIDFQGMQHDVTCYVSGKMRSHFIYLSKGDKVKVEIPLYDINVGRIVYRLTKQATNMGPPRRPKK